MTIRVYKLKRDYGFAPNPFHGVCTLACCKPSIRKHAAIGDWVIGVGSVHNGLLGKIMYAMVVEEKITFDDYWSNEKYQAKKVVPNGTRKRMYGDNIYHKDPVRNAFIQEDSHHSFENGSTNIDNLERDTSHTDQLLISRDFIYFGENAVTPPPRIKSLGEKGFPRTSARYYKIVGENEKRKIKKWLRSYDWSCLHGVPHDWRKR